MAVPSARSHGVRPALTQTPTAAVSRCGIGSVTTVRPFFKLGNRRGHLELSLAGCPSNIEQSAGEFHRGFAYRQKAADFLPPVFRRRCGRISNAAGSLLARFSALLLLNARAFGQAQRLLPGGRQNRSKPCRPPVNCKNLQGSPGGRCVRFFQLKAGVMRRERNAGARRLLVHRCEALKLRRAGATNLRLAVQHGAPAVATRGTHRAFGPRQP